MIFSFIIISLAQPQVPLKFRQIGHRTSQYHEYGQLFFPQKTISAWNGIAFVCHGCISHNNLA